MPTQTDNAEHLIQGLGRRYLAVLVAVVALLLLDQAVLQPLLARLTYFAPVINLSGRQRMLSQRLTKAALAWSLEPQQEKRWQSEMQASLPDWKRVQKGLVDGDRELNLPGSPNPKIRAAFAEIQPHHDAICAAVERLMAGELDPAQVSSILAHEQQYLTGMDGIVSLFEAEARAHVFRLRCLGIAAMFAVFALLWGLYQKVLRPATTVIREQVQKLTESELRYRLLVERMHDGLAIFCPQGKLKYVNDRFCQLVQRSREELLDRPVQMLTRGEHRDELHDLLRTATERPPFVREIRWSTPYGKECVTLVATGTSDSNVESASEFFLVATDITRQKQAEASLREARDALEERVAERTRELTSANAALAREVEDRRRAEDRNRQLQDQLTHAARVTALGQLATGLAHELNQPLGAITNFAEALEVLTEQEDQLTADMRNIAVRIRDSALRAGLIVRRMRNFVQSKQVARSELEMNELIRDVVDLCEPQARQRSVTMTVEIDETQSEIVHVDPIQIQQVLVNLIQNAMQAMEAVPEDQRQLIVRSHRSVEGVIVEVEDHGPGFAPDVLSTSFAPFHSTKADGMGMGLSISRSILAAHDGELWAENLSTGGARLSFELPASQRMESHERADRLHC